MGIRYLPSYGCCSAEELVTPHECHGCPTTLSTPHCFGAQGSAFPKLFPSCIPAVVTAGIQLGNCFVLLSMEGARSHTGEISQGQTLICPLMVGCIRTLIDSY